MLSLKDSSNKELLVNPASISAVLPGNLLLIGQYTIKIDGASVNEIKKHFAPGDSKPNTLGANKKPGKSDS